MGAISELPIPQTGQIQNTPVPETGGTEAWPGQKDEEATRAIQGGFRRGLRSSMVSLGGALNSLASGVGENLGLSEFAADRMKAAEEDMRHADAVGPRVRDIKGIKDFADVVDFTAGLAGETTGAVAPMAAGGMAGGLRGAVAVMYPGEVGSQLFRTRNAPASAGQRLGAAAVTGAASTAAQVAVPAALAGHAARGVTKVLPEIGKGSVGFGAASAAGEVARQVGHTAVEPGRDKSQDNEALLNAGVGGLVAGAGLGALGGLAGRAKTLSEARQDLGARERPSKLDPELDSLPDDVSGIEKALGEHDAKVDSDLASRESEPWAKKYEGWRDDPEKREAFHAEVATKHRDEVDRPFVKGALDRLSKFMDKFRPPAPAGAKASNVRTRIDMAVMDEVNRHLPEHLREAMTSEEKLKLANDVRDFALHTAGRSDELPGPGAPETRRGFEPGVPSYAPMGHTVNAAGELLPIRNAHPKYEPKKGPGGASLEEAKQSQGMSGSVETFQPGRTPTTRSAEYSTAEGLRPRARVIPHALMDIFGDQLHPLLNKVQKALMHGDVRRGERVDWKKSVGVATKSRGRLGAQLDDVVRTHMDPTYLEDPQTRDMAVSTARDRVLDMVQSGKFDEALLDKLFGKGKGDVVEAFDRMRPELSDWSPIDEEDRGKPKREALADEEADTETEARGEEEQPHAPGEHPLEDKRLGVPMDPLGKDFDRTLQSLKSEEPFTSGRVRYRVELQEDGRAKLFAEDAGVPGDLSDAELAGARDRSGKSGQENGTLTVVAKDHREGMEGRNTQWAVSIPRLTSMAMRTREAIHGEGNFVKRAVLEGLSRLLSDSRFLKLKEGNSLELDPNTPVAFVRGETMTWAQVLKLKPEEIDRIRQELGREPMGNDLSSAELDMRQRTDDRVAEARGAAAKGEITDGIVPDLKGEIESTKEALEDLTAKTKEARAEHDKAKKEGVKFEDRKPLWKAWKDAQRAQEGVHRDLNRLESTLDDISEELHRRDTEGDFPTSDSRGVRDTEEVRENIGEAQGREKRTYQEETGAALGESARGPRGPDPDAPAPSDAKVDLFDRSGKQWEVRKTEGGKYYVADAKTMDTSGKTYESQKDAVKAWEEWYKKQYPKENGKKSEMRIGVEPMSEETRRAVGAEIERLLGPEVSKKVRSAMTEAGKFIGAGPEETILINAHAIDPMGVGRHEALHALVARLSKANPEAANTLLNAAHSPVIVSKLRELLKDHPEALKQLGNAEERAAYMYEFWAQKALEVGPKTETLFSKIKDWLSRAAHEMFGIGEDPSTMHKAEALLQAFHRGDFADRSTVAEVANRIVPRDPLREQWLGKAADWANRVFSTSDGYIRDQKIPAFTGAADKFLSPLGQQGNEAGMMQTRHTVFNRFMNRYVIATKGLDQAAVSRVLESLQRKDDSLLTNQAEKSAKAALRGMLDDVFDYMKEKGVKAVEWNEAKRTYEEHDIEKVKDYFPRMFDRAYLTAHKGEFVAMLERHRVENAGKVFDKLTTSSKASPDESDSTAGVTFFSPSTMARKLDIPEHELAPFMKKDLGSMMYDYVRYATRRGEYASRFGNQGQELSSIVGRIDPDTGKRVDSLAMQQGATEAQIKHFSNYVQAMEGTLGNHIDGGLRKFMSSVLAYQNWRLLPLSLFSSLVDPNGIVVRGGTVSEGFGAFTRGIRELVSTKEDEQRAFARAVGAINDATEEHMVADMYGMHQGASWAKWMNDTLFKYNGMESWNNSMRTAAASAARSFLIRHATEPTTHSERWLSELGLKRDDIRVTEGGGLDITRPNVVDALNKWVDGAVLRPHAGTRPIWGSDPHYMLVLHLKQFTYSFQKTIVAQTAHELMHGNFRPLMVLGSYVPFIIAADVLRAMVTPGSGDNERYKKWGAKEWLAHGVTRSGIAGPGQYVGDSLVDTASGRWPLEPLGPTAQQMGDLLRASLGAPGTSFQTEALRALPIVPTLFPGRLDRIANED